MPAGGVFHNTLIAVEEVARERVRGATWSMARLARALALDSMEGLVDCSIAGKVATLIESARSGMAPVRLVAWLLREACRRGMDPGEPARRLLAYYSDARRLLVYHAVEALRGAVRLATFSYSSTVEDVVSRLRPARVVVYTSYPGGEGVEAARSLRRRGIGVELRFDTDTQVLSGVDAVLVGADTVTQEPCVVNKTGTLPLALASTHHSVPVVSVFESYKIAGEDVTCDRVDVDVMRERVEGWGTVEYNLFDKTPGYLFAGFITEHGAIEPQGGALRETRRRLLERLLD